jgi:hypothetical protein
MYWEGGHPTEIGCRIWLTIAQSKFRSPNEFLPHVDWLFKTSTSLEDHGAVRQIFVLCMSADNNSVLVSTIKGLNWPGSRKQEEVSILPLVPQKDRSLLATNQ